MRPVPPASRGRALAAVLQRALPECGPGAMGRRALPSGRRAGAPDRQPATTRTLRESPPTMADTLTVTDNRTGKQYQIPIKDGVIRATDLRQIKNGRRRRGPDDLRPGVHEHRGVPQPDHLHRRRQGHPRVSRLPDRAAGREVHVPGNGVPDHLRRAAHLRAARGVEG